MMHVQNIHILPPQHIFLDLVEIEVEEGEQIWTSNIVKVEYCDLEKAWKGSVGFGVGSGRVISIKLNYLDVITSD